MPAKSKVSATRSGLQVTAQQSRFHKDSIELDAPTTKEILVKDLSITLGSKEILSHTELFLKENEKYVLVGRNGVGKSTLLKAVADGHIPGIPYSLRVLLLGQTRELDFEGAVSGLTIRDETVLEHVVRSDRLRERYLHEGAVLSKGLDSQVDPTAPVQAYRTVSHERLRRRLAEGRKLAEQRSGARGFDARKELNRLEDAYTKSQEKLAENFQEIDTSILSAETQAAVDMLSEVQSALSMMNSAAAESKARTILLGLGFPLDRVDDSMSKLSGGWRTRCDLACALSQTADVLLLDEPTNFLDLPSIIWLQKYLTELQDTTVVVVTHDRDFADAVGEELLILREHKLETFREKLSTYENEKKKKIKWLTVLEEAQDKQKAHMEKTIKGNIQAAKRTGDDKKLKQAASRKKKLDDRMGMQVNEKGHKFKKNRDMAGWHLTSRSGIDIPGFDPPVKLNFPTAPPDLRFPGALVSLEKVCYSYPDEAGKKRPQVLNNVELNIHPRERVGVCGLNGSGKTTLVSLVIGTNESGSIVNPTKGAITRHTRAKAARFSQRVVEQLEAFGQANPEATSLKHLMDVAEGKLDEKEARAILAGMGMQGQLASDVPIAALSGGQKVRLAFAKLVWSPPHLLVLDEVTTHLDADTILALIVALRSYDGALVVVTHDRFFMRSVVEGQNPYRLGNLPGAQDQGGVEHDEDEGDAEGVRKPGVVYRMSKGQLRVLDGGMRQYEEIAARAAARLTKGCAP